MDLNVYLETLTPAERTLIVQKLERVSAYIEQRTPVRGAGGGGAGALTQSRKKQTRRYRKNRCYRRGGKKGKKTLNHFKKVYTK